MDKIEEMGYYDDNIYWPSDDDCDADWLEMELMQMFFEV